MRVADKEYGKIDFFKSAALMGGISAVAVIISLVAIIANGFKYGIDFSGGTEVQIKFESQVDTSKVRKALEDFGNSSATVQSFGEEKEFLIRLGSIQGATDKETNNLLNEMIEKVTSGLKSTFAADGIIIQRVDSVGPQIGDELKKNGLLAAFYSFLMILIYIGLRFDYQYAPSAVICLIHDAMITMGVFAAFGREVNVQTMAAILTIIGYSLNDTIVTFDRIRENLTVFRDKTFKFIINRSLNDVLSRTLLTSITTMLAVITMYIFAGGVIEDFAFTLAIGVVVGTYSSIFVASPLVLIFDKLKK